MAADDNSELRVIDSVRIPVASLGRFGSRGLSVPVAFQLGGSSAAINLPFPGVFPVTISAGNASTTLASGRTFVAYADAKDSGSPVATSIVLTQNFAPSRTPDGELAIAAPTRAAMQKLVTLLTSVNAPFTVQVQPETLAALAESTDQADRTLLSSLSASLSGRTVVASTYVPIDPSSARSAGMETEFTRQLRLGETTMQQLVPGVRLSRSAWISHWPVTESGASLLRDLGATSIVSVPLPSTEQPIDTALRSRVAHAELRDGTLISMLSTDDGIGAILDDPSRDTAQSGIRIAAEILAEREELLATEADPSTLRIVVSASAGTIGDTAALATLARALGATPGISLKDFSVGLVPTVESPTVEFAKDPARDVSLIGAAIFSVGLDRIAVGSMLPADSPEPLLWDKMLSIIPAETITNADDYVLGIRKLMRGVKLNVVPPAASTFTLGERNASIRLQIRNKSTSTLKVRVTLTSAKLLFPEAPPTVELVPNASTDVVVPVIARSNGRFPVTVRITTPTGNARVTAPIVLTARVNIIAGLGQLISFLALGLLLAWWATSWGRSRRRRRTTTVENS